MTEASTRAAALPGASLRLAVPIAAAAAAVFALDLSLPPGEAPGPLYLGLVLLGWWLAKPGHILALAAAATTLMLAGLLWPPAPGAIVAALPEAAPSLFAIWATAALLAAIKRRTDALERAAEELDARAAAAQARAEVAARSAADLMAGMSHELRTPLNAIIGFSEIAKTEMLGPIGSTTYRDYMRDINESGRRLLALIERLLVFARIEARSLELQEDRVEMGSCLRACLAQVAGPARAADVLLDLQLGDDLPPLRADAAKLRRVLLQVLENALAATGAGGTVRVAAWARPESGYVVQVSDQGDGLALEEVPQALALFGRAGGPPRRADLASLDLPLVKALVELHAGSLDVQSRPGAGTTVTLRFPAARLLLEREAA